MTSLSVSAHGPIGPGGSTWVAHKPDGGDWFAFSDPAGKLSPFDVDSDGLTIRVQKNGDPNNGFNGYTGGLLSSLDHDGNGFAQQYGYFEVSMQTPGGPNTWPAFWLLSRNGLVNPSIDVAEVDVTESYGNYGAGPNNSPAGDPNVTTAAWHQWNANGTQSSDGHPVEVGGFSTGYHTYGVDIEPTGLTYYVDRQVAWTAPIFEAAKQPMYVLLDLALGGGSYNNAAGTGYDWNLTPAINDLHVQYVSVWASPASPNYSPGLSAGVTGTTIGTTGSWGSGNTGVYTASDGANAAFDGDLNTFFDAPASTNGQGVWAGLDLGTSKLITAVSFAPRIGGNDRMPGGKFQASNTADFSSGVVDLYRIPSMPADGIQTIPVNSGTAFRYVRYLSPSGGWGNIAELAFQALKPPAAPSGVAATAASGSQIDLSWSTVNGATAFNIYRGTRPDGEGAIALATSVTGTRFSDLTVAPGTTYYYKLAASNPSGVGPQSAEVSATPQGAGPVNLTGATIGTTGSWLTGDTGVYTASDGANAAFDGDLATAFDAPSSSGGSGVWVGEDLRVPSVITQITFSPRSNFVDRMIGGRFQVSNTADFSSGVVDLYTITGTPSVGMQTVLVNSGIGYRYFRYLSPAAGWGNVAEIALRGTASATPPVVPPPGDFNADGKIDFNDFLVLQNHFNLPGTYSDGDADGNGLVDFNDFLILQNHFGFGT
ncbi:MAG: exsH 1 [Phycisphaerales bacterium]|nr:exsH 1 [Phycisphaerales bacterium]